MRAHDPSSVHVVHFSSVHAPNDVRIFERECKALAQAGYRVTYIAPSWTAFAEAGSGVTVRTVPRLAGRLRRFTLTLSRVTREAWRQAADLYHFHDPELMPAALLMRALGKRVIYDAHENLPQQAVQSRVFPARLRPVASRVADWCERFIAARVNGVVAADHEIAARLRPCNRNLVTLENFPVLEDYPHAPGSGTARYESGMIVNFGGISARTCTRTIVQALALLPGDLRARMVLGGRATPECLQKELEGSPGWARVDYQGRTGRTRMVEQLATSALALVLFSDQPNHHYVRSNRFFEALAAGLPVITSDFPHWRELVTRIGCGIAVNSADPAAIAGAIEYLLTHPSEAAEMGRRGREAICNEFSWEKEKTALLELYSRILGEAPAFAPAATQKPVAVSAEAAAAPRAGGAARHAHAPAPALAPPRLRFERIAPAAFDWTGVPAPNLCHSPAWLRFLCETQRGEPVVARLVQDESVAGYFVGMLVSRGGLKILGSPFPGWSTPYMGMTLFNGTARRDAVRELVRFAFDDLRCVHFEFMDRHLAADDLRGLGFEHRVLSGFEIDLARSEDVLFAAMTSACRRCIRKAEKCAVTVEEVHDDPSFAAEYYEQLKDVFAKQKLVPTHDLARVRSLIRHLEPTGRLLLLRARDPQGHSIATGIFPAISAERAYFWGMASWRAHQILRPNEALLWYAMRYWKSRGVRFFDMGGSGEYKRKYGGYEIAVPWFRISKYPVIPILRETARRTVKLRQRVLARLAAGPAPSAPAAIEAD